MYKVRLTALTFNKKLTGGFVITLLLLCVLTYSSYRAIKETESAHKWETHTHSVINEANQVVEKLTDADVHQLWYLIDKRNEDLSTYQLRIIEIHRTVFRLKSETNDNPLQKKQIDSLQYYLQQRMTEMDLLVKSAIRLPPNASISRSTLMKDGLEDKCRLWLNRIISTEEKLLISRQKASIGYGEKASEIIACSAGISIVYLILLYLLIKRTFAAKQAIRESLALSENKFHNAFEYSGIGMAIVSPEGKWIDINSHVSEMLGYSKEELLTKTFQDITHPDDLLTDLSLLKQLHNKEIEMYQMEKRYIHKEGFIVWALLTVSLIWNPDNTPNFHISQIIDITAIKKLMDEQQLKNQTLLHTSSQLNDEIRQLRDFNGIVTHNLRGPIGSIVNLTDMIMTEDSEQEKQELVEMLSTSAIALNDTLGDLMQILEVRLNGSISGEQCSLQEVLETTLNMFTSEIIRSHVEVISRFDVSEVNFPKFYLESIFHNMISNSLKYQMPEVKPIIKISSSDANGRTQIIFEDNGIGIDLDRYGNDMFKFSKVFHSGYDSKGVGLFITKNQIETYGGTIAVESKPGKGSKFIVTI